MDAVADKPGAEYKNLTAVRDACQTPVVRPHEFYPPFPGWGTTHLVKVGSVSSGKCESRVFDNVSL